MSDDYNIDPNDLDAKYENTQSVSLTKIKQASIKLKQSLMSQWLATKQDEHEKRESLYFQQGLVDKLVGQLESIINESE